MTTEIMLSRGLVALIDDVDASLVTPFKWSARPSNGGLWYAVRSVRLATGGRAWQRMHQFLTGHVRTDHVNGNGLDNRRANLRPVTVSQNAQNKRKYAGCASQFKGVTRSKSGQRWRARIKHAGKLINLGTFPDEVSAARAYDEAARDIFGKFAALNFPADGERSAVDTVEIVPAGWMPLIGRRRINAILTDTQYDMPAVTA